MSEPPYPGFGRPPQALGFFARAALSAAVADPEARFPAAIRRDDAGIEFLCDSLQVVGAAAPAGYFFFSSGLSKLALFITMSRSFDGVVSSAGSAFAFVTSFHVKSPSFRPV